MKHSSLAESIASFAYDFDPYGFADDFDSFADGVDRIAQLLESDPDLLASTIFEMVSYCEDADEQQEGNELLWLVRARAKARAQHGVLFALVRACA